MYRLKTNVKRNHTSSFLTTSAVCNAFLDKVSGITPRSFIASKGVLLVLLVSEEVRLGKARLGYFLFAAQLNIFEISMSNL